MISATYSVCLSGNSWYMRVASASGGGTIVIVQPYVGQNGYRDPFTNPPTTQAEAVAAINEMNNYQSRATRGAWATPAASLAHERRHEAQWKCVVDNGFPAFLNDICALNVPRSSYPDAGSALAAMQPTANTIRVSYMSSWGTTLAALPHGPNSAPWCLGQAEMNNATAFVIALAASNGWTVPTSITTPCNPGPVC